MNHKLFLSYLQKGLHILFAAALIAGLVISVKPTQAVTAASTLASGPKRTITIEALIDGRSQLILRKNTAQWYHLDFSVPGRWGDINAPTIINGEEWFPAWPDVPDVYNYFCNCYSDIFKGVKPGLHRNNMTVALNVIEARGNVFIAEYPSASNDYALVIEFDDDPFDAAAAYQIELVLTFGGKS
jgi:hypothetical protein